MFSKPVYNNIKYPQPQYQKSITRLPSFTEVLNQIQLPNEFPLNKPNEIKSDNISPVASPSPFMPYYYNYNYQVAPVVPATIPNVTPITHTPMVQTPIAHTPVSQTPNLGEVSPKTLLPTPPPSNKDLKDGNQKRKHVCKTCSRSFTTSGHLARHNRIHTGERKHVCPWPNCDARFARQDNCMQHYKTHTNGKKRKSNLNFRNRSLS